MVAKFSSHIEQQKEQVNTMINKLREAVCQQLETKKQELMLNLDAQVKAFVETLNYYKQKVHNHKEDETPKGPETAATFESLYRDVSKITNASELKKLLLTQSENMKDTQTFAEMKGDEAKKLVTEAVERMNAEVMNMQNLKPSISWGANGSLEGPVTFWEEQIEFVLNGFPIRVKDIVKPIIFQIKVNKLDKYEVPEEDFDLFDDF